MAAKSEPPNRLAEKIMGERELIADDGGRLYEYGGGCWRHVSDPVLHAWALAADGAYTTTTRRRSEISSFIKARSLRPFEWGRVADTEVPVANGVVDCVTGEIRPHRPEDYLERVIPHPYSPKAPCPTWLRCLDDWFGDPDGPAPEDRGEGQYPPEIRALQEFFGYIVLSHAKFKKALVLYGESDCGKTVPLHVAKLLVGLDACCSLSVDHMDDPVRRAVIKGRLLNVVTELSVDAMVADGGFKALVSTEEPILLDAKYERPEMYIPRAKHVFATNALPRMTDRTEGVLNRLLIIPFLRVIPRDRQDDGLEARLAAELPGILCWAVEGAKRLIEQGGKFTDIPGTADILTEMRTDANPVRQYLFERLVPEATSAIPLTVLVDDYNRWNKSSRKVGTRFLGKLLRECGQVIKNVRYEGTVQASLVGFQILDKAMPSRFIIEAGAILHEGREIDGAGVFSGRYAGPPSDEKEGDG